MKASEQVNVVYCTTLKFAAALLQRDCHDFLSTNRRIIEWALGAFESYGDRHPESDTQYEPYGSMILHIMSYDSKHEHTPNEVQFTQYLRHVPHNPKSWGFNLTTNEEHALTIEAYREQVESGEIPDVPDAEVLLDRFLGQARLVRFRGMTEDAYKRALGAERIWDSTLKCERPSEWKDAVRVIENLARYDFVPEGTTAKKPVPEIQQEVLYGWLGQKAAESGMPLGFIYPALIGVYAGNRIRVADRAVHPALDVALLGGVGTGKSQAIERTERVLGMKDIQHGGSVCHRSASSDRGLFKLFGDDPKQKDAVQKAGGTFVMCLTELRHMFTKLAMQNNSLPAALCALWDSGKDFGTADKYASSGCAVTLSIVGGLKCNSPEEFSEVFGADTMHGLYSRFVFGYTGEKWEYHPVDIVAQPRKPAEITVPADRWSRLTEWRREKPGRGRLSEMAMRIAVITEAADKGGDLLLDTGSTSWSELREEVTGMDAMLDSLGLDYEKQKRSDANAAPEPLIQRTEYWKTRRAQLSAEALEAALRFMEWQECLREAYTPSEAIDDDARCTEAILKAVEEHGGFKWNTMCKNRHWTEKWGARRVQGVRNALAGTGQISYDKDSGWVSKA